MDPRKNYHSNFKNDKRIKGGKTGKCPLCKEEKNLILSHVTPKWCYKWAKAEGNGSFTGHYPSLDVSVKEQDGSKHYILCQQCDQFLGDSENYSRVIMHGTEVEQQKIGLTRTITKSADEIYDGVNIELIQRFMLGLVFKSHYATSAPFHNLQLDEKNIDKIRTRILNPVIEDMDYPIISMQFSSEVVPDIDPKAIMIPQQGTTNNGEESFSFLIAGWEWLIFLNDDRHLTDDPFVDRRMRETGQLLVFKGDIIDQRHINNAQPLSRRERRKLAKANKNK